MSLYNYIIPNIAYIIYGILGVLLLFQLYYILFVYGKLAAHKARSFKDAENLPPLSVIICAHNEQHNLETFLPKILAQDYPEYEVIVVDDYSSDESQWVLQAFKATHPHLRIVEIKEHIQLKHSKKFALTLGIKAAKYEHLVMTDADCEPQSSEWLKEIGGAYSASKEIVLGYSPYFKKPGFLNKLIRFETTHTAMSYLSYALKKDPYMGVGRNLSYLKSLFFKGKGFNAHMHIKSGDDDLFVNQNATKQNTHIAIAPDAHMYSVPKETWSSYYKQKARHSGASVAYKNRHQFMLATQLVTAFLFYIVLFLAIALFPSLWYIGIGVFFFRFLCQFIVFRPIFLKLKVKDLLFWLPILDVFFYFYICLNGLFNRKKKQRSW
ncbi:hypothetical protein M472_17650 [Sphingobacterium paucimobilis HER1398]|uniref:Glycosyltransferase 2-like domain-containing protein n=2 Tax=Sphingobacterium TaxID=28453 RepID=U2JD57_9SPHI|nr:hypothetical protein M472_17650 [Sphingobacterium paucimobilis HER1398]